jgi:poly(3-hydroxybutyrate) depolymerase
MIYQAYQAQADMMQPLREIAKGALSVLGQRWLGITESTPARNLAAAYELIAFAGLSHHRPAFGIETVTVGNREAAVSEEVAFKTPFGTLLHFKKDLDTVQPRVLVVAPMSGHFATLLRETVRTMLPDHDLYITDWHNARDISLRDGSFGVGEFVDHLIKFLEVMGPGSHLVAICQPTVAALAAVSLMAEDGNPAQPLSMTLMAGPIDTRVNPTKVNDFATGKPIEWFERNVIGTVPARFAGGVRQVYPGFVQLAAFMSMNIERHVKSFRTLFQHIVDGETEKADAIRKFYDEYFAVMDLPGEFYLETISAVFQEFLLPQGKLEVNGRRVNPAAIRRTALLTVEGERDDICSVGQTVVAQDLCTSIRPYRKMHHVQTGVGHYGVFSGRRWSTQIYPMVRDIIYVSA